MGKSKILCISKIVPLVFKVIVLMIFMEVGCKVPESIAYKTGAQLWAENCTRCHYNPEPKDYADQSWEIIGKHMKIKAGLTDVEMQKVVAFLKTAN